MSQYKSVWSDELGDLRKKSKKGSGADEVVDESKLMLRVRRLTSGKGRSVIEITALPLNKKWCQKLCKDIKKSLGVGGTFKDAYIEIHGEKLDPVTIILDKKNIKWKKTGG